MSCDPHHLTPAGGGLVDHARAPCTRHDPMLGITDPGQAEIELTAGMLPTRRAPGRCRVVAWIARVDRDVLADLGPQPTRLGEAVTALAVAAVTLRAGSPHTSRHGR